MNMQFLSAAANPSTTTHASITIEPAENCDGSLCHQPLFDQDGGLHFVAPHCHLVEWGAKGPRYHAVLCDFPG